MQFLSLTYNAEPVVTNMPCACFANLVLPQSNFAGTLMFYNNYGSLEVAPDTLGTNYQLIYFNEDWLSQSGVPLEVAPSQTLAVVINDQNCTLTLREQTVDTAQPSTAIMPVGYDTGLDNGYTNQTFLAPLLPYVEPGYWEDGYSL